uniref:Uncharacterized protein n=1 Tax=Ditylenchus dipsaci TaxID=166011 RepID=A0A915DIQ5_9BILA
MPARVLKPKEDPVSGKEIIQSYVELRPLAVDKYNQLHKALDLFESWDAQSKIGFLSQFMDLADILESNCSDIVAQFCRLKWITVPSVIRQNFVDFLASLAILHTSHVESILKSVTSHFIPELKMDSATKEMRLSLSSGDQEEIYQLAHRCVEHIISCCPRYTSSLNKCCALNFPHFRHHTLKIMGYIRNLIVLGEQFPSFGQDLWSLIIDHMVHLDTASFGKASFDSEQIFQSVGFCCFF